AGIWSGTNTTEFQISEKDTTATEPSLAVDPTNPMHVVVGFNQIVEVSGMRIVKCAWAETIETIDGGVTWSRGSITMPSDFTSRGDPWVRFGLHGELFYSCTGISRTGSFKIQQTRVFVAKSTSRFARDFGTAVPVTRPSIRPVGSTEEEVEDHPSIAVVRNEVG